MNNKPVAWFEQDPDMKSVWYQSEQDNPNAIPLYTHPVKELDEQFEKGFKAGKEERWKAHKFHHPAKEQDTDCQYCKQGCIRCDARKQLTDEEIGDFTHRMVLCCGVHPNSADINVLGLKFIVEEILRKAQEK